MPGTLANEMENRVQPAIIKARTNRLLTHFADQEKLYKKQKIGQIEKVLFESKQTSSKGTYLSGFSADYQRVVCFSEETQPNQIRTVELVNIDEIGDLIGVLLPKKADLVCLD